MNTCLYIVIGVLFISSTACNGSNQHPKEDYMSDTGNTTGTSINRQRQNEQSNADQATTGNKETGAGNAGNVRGAVADEGAVRFIQHEIVMNQTNLKLAEMARDQSNNPQIKDVAAAFLQDYAQLLDKLQKLAAGKPYVSGMPGNDEGSQHLQALAGKTGSQFDIAWVAVMKSEHKRAIAKYDTLQKQTTDSAVKEYIRKTLPVLREHQQRLASLY
jgi:putative membrane protein